MMLQKVTVSAAIVLCFAALTPALVSSQDASPADDQVSQWIEQLDSPKFSQRANATRQLQRLGVAVIEPLKNVVLSGNSDAADRAMGILKKHFQGKSQSLSDAAGEALSQIAQTPGHPKASVAEQILNPASDRTSTPNALPPARFVPPIRQQNRVSVSVKTINGVREISVDENGRKFSFKDQGEALKVQRPDDQGGVKTKVYENEAALEKADAEAYKIYKKYASQNGGQIRIQLNGGGFGGFPPGMLPGQMPMPGWQPRMQIPAQPIPRQPAPPKPPQKTDSDLIEV